MAGTTVTISQLNAQIDKLVSQLPVFLLKTMEENLLIAKKEINSRIVETGMDAKGTKLLPYTAKYLRFKKDVGRYRGHVDLQLGNYSINKAIAASARRAIKKVKKTKYFANKAKNKTRRNARIEEIKAKATERKNQKRAKAIAKTSRLWSSIQLTSKTQQGDKYSIVIAPLDELNKKKASGLAVKRGDFLALNQKEQNLLGYRFEEKYSAFIAGFIVK